MLHRMKAVEIRYAEALAQLAIEKNEIETTANGFNSFIKFLKEEQEYKEFLFDLQIDKPARKELLDRTLGKTQYPKILKDFINLLVDKDRINLVRGIRNEYLNIVDKLEKKVFAKVFSPYRLKDDQIKKIDEFIKKRYSATSVNIQQVIDRGIVGGIRIQVGDTIIDYSIKGILNKMLREIK